MPNSSIDLSAYQILYLPIVAWNTVTQRPQHIAREFAARGAKVYHVNQYQTSSSGFTTILPTQDERIYEVISIKPPYMKFRGLQPVIYDVLKRPNRIDTQCTDIYQALDSNLLTIVWVNVPYWAPYVQTAISKDITVVYDVLDNYNCFLDLAPLSAQLNLMHNMLLKRADYITYTAQRMLSTQLKTHTQKALYLPNACHPEKWDIQYNSTNPPIIGYFGAVADWFDMDVLVSLAKESNISIEIASPPISVEHRETLKLLTSISHLGLKPHDELPKIVSRWACAIIPFLDTRLTRSTDPIKLYEYMAAGLPIVTTALPEIEYIVSTMPEKAKPTLVQPGDAKSFVEAVKNEVEQDTLGKRSLRRSWAIRHSWSNRMESFLERSGIGV